MSRALRRAASAPRARRAITLVELLVVTGILVLLAGLAAAGLSAGARLAERTRTRTAMDLVHAAIVAHEAEAGPITWGPDGDIHPETPYVYVVTEVYREVARSSAGREILARLDSKVVRTYDASAPLPPWIRFYEEEILVGFYDGEHTVLDAWGTPLYATHPGPIAGPDADPADVDPDGTLRTANERDFGSADSRRICLVSAGRDRRFGVRTEFPGLDGDALRRAIERAREDNLYTYEPLPPDPVGAATP